MCPSRHAWSNMTLWNGLGSVYQSKDLSILCRLKGQPELMSRACVFYFFACLIPSIQLIPSLSCSVHATLSSNKLKSLKFFLSQSEHFIWSAHHKLCYVLTLKLVSGPMRIESYHPDTTLYLECHLNPARVVYDIFFSFFFITFSISWVGRLMLLAIYDPIFCNSSIVFLPVHWKCCESPVCSYSFFSCKICIPLILCFRFFQWKHSCSQRRSHT